MTSPFAPLRLVAHDDQARLVVRALRDRRRTRPCSCSRICSRSSDSTWHAVGRELRRALGEPLGRELVRRRVREVARAVRPRRDARRALGRGRRAVVAADDARAARTPSCRSTLAASATCACRTCRRRARPPPRAPAPSASPRGESFDDVRERAADASRLARGARDRRADGVGVGAPAEPGDARCAARRRSVTVSAPKSVPASPLAISSRTRSFAPPGGSPPSATGTTDDVGVEAVARAWLRLASRAQGYR